MANIWQFRYDEKQPAPSKEIIEAAEGSPLLAKLLVSRGINQPEKIRAFLNMQDYQPTSGWELPDIKPAVERVVRAIHSKEAVLVYGDFDVDGITGTSILYQTLRFLGANVSFYIPDRATEGHGLNTPALVRLTSSRQLKLVITTDTGITNFAEVSLLNGLGVDTIITDHHALPENLPPALANVNPQRLLANQPDHPLGQMCGAGVAYKFCELVLEAMLGPEKAAAYAETLLDLTAIGTVVDMVPLHRENRYLVWRGLQVLQRRERPGIREILEQAGVAPETPITSETLGFTIGPRLNAVGRLDKADQAVELMTGKDPERIRVIASHLERLNRRRRDLCDQTFLEADSFLQRQGGLGDQRAIILGSPDWNPGIIGIVASRLIEKYHVPVFMMVIDESKGIARCSARSIPGFHLHDELLALEEYFEHFGGHAGAGGFALKLERLESFKKALHEIAMRKITDEQMRPVIEVDARLDWSQINPHLIELVNRMAPFGMDNPSPKFVVENVNIAAQRGLGEGEKHLKLVLTSKADMRQTNTLLEGLIWNHGNRDRFDTRAPYSFVVVPELNTFNGNTKVQLIIEDYLAGESSQKVLEVLPSQPEGRSVSARPTPSLSAATQPRPEAARPADETPVGPQWIDHRSRESVETFIGQLMLPLQDSRQVLIYHEGRKPEIPFLDESLLADRLRVKQAEELIFWDLPPSLEQFQQVLNWVRPEVIHLVGGKYQSVPVFQSEQNYLKLLVQILRKENDPCELELESFASRLATSTAVITHGLMLLEKIGMLESRLARPGEPDRLLVRLKPENASGDAMHDRLEYVTFQQSLKEVGKFRSWLLSSPLDAIRMAVSAPAIPSLSGGMDGSSDRPQPADNQKAGAYAQH